jgi:phosphoglycolate phosphatase
MLLDLGVELDLDPQSMLMVGDTTHDLGMARAAGAYAIGVSYGAHPRDQLLTEQSLAIVDDVAELKAALLRRVLA